MDKKVDVIKLGDFDPKTLKPIGNKLIVEIIEEKDPEFSTAEKGQKLTFGEVHAIGKDVDQIKVGDGVFFVPHAGIPFDSERTGLDLSGIYKCIPQHSIEFVK